MSHPARTTAELEEEVLAGMTDEQRAEALDVIERLASAIHDGCEIFGTVYFAAVLHRLGPELARKR